MPKFHDCWLRNNTIYGLFVFELSKKLSLDNFIRVSFIRKQIVFNSTVMKYDV